MEKMSKLILALAEQVLVQPTEKSSREAVAAALLLAHVAWNRAVDPLGGDQVGYYRKVLRALRPARTATPTKLGKSANGLAKPLQNSARNRTF